MPDTDSEENTAMVAQLKASLEAHLKEHQTHREEYLERQRHQDEAHEKNMIAISELTEATKGLVTAWNTANGVHKFFKWVSGFAVLGIVYAYVVGLFSTSPPIS